MRRATFAIAALLALPLAGCPAEGGEDEPVDLTREFPELAGEGFALRTPEYVIPAGTEKQYCFITTYDGPDVGITATYNYQTAMGHHVTIFGTNATERDFPDGMEWDCTETEALDMTAMEPIIIGGTIDYQDDGVLNAFELPEGMAAPLENGTRIIVQSHYVNVRPEPVKVQDEAQILTVPEEDVEVWTAPLVATVTDFQIPANTDDHTLVFDCDYDESVSLLYIGGHLHEWGKSFKATHTRGGVSEVIYEVPEWDPVFRDAPLYTPFEEDEFTLEVGDTLTTECVWDNNTDDVLEFPAEMCVTFGMVYPANVPVICSADIVE